MIELTIIKLIRFKDVSGRIIAIREKLSLKVTALSTKYMGFAILGMSFIVP